LIPKLIIFYLIVRFADLIWRGAMGDAFTLSRYSFFFWIENLLYLYVVVMLYSEESRGNRKTLFYGAVLMLLAGGLYRFDVFLIGFDPGMGWHYFPSLGEIFITLGMIAIELMAYLVFVKKLPVLPKVEHV
jgi:Ni/Fe-hydrogenase subunit HybB-like protein